VELRRSGGRHIEDESEQSPEEQLDVGHHRQSNRWQERECSTLASACIDCFARPFSRWDFGMSAAGRILSGDPVVEDHRVSYGWSSVCLGVGDWAVLSLASGSLPDS
jgi:hypothetical protein